MVHTAVDLLQQLKCIDGSRNALEDCTRLMAVSNTPGSDFGFDMATNFHTQEQDARWAPELVRLVQEFGGGQGSKPNSPKVNYHTLQINRVPCGCLYNYDGTNGKVLVWGSDNSPSIIREMMQHFIQRLGLQDDHDVPGCLVINVYKDETHHIDWHSDANERWGAMDMDTNIFTWNLGAHGFFQLTVKARSALAKSIVSEGKASNLKKGGYPWGWVVPPKSISVMSKKCQRSCMHRVMKPTKARTVKAVRDLSGYIHHSATTPRVIVSLRSIRRHDRECPHDRSVPRWLLGISPPNCSPCASTDAAITPSTQDMSYVAATSQTPVSVDVSALPISAPVPNDVQKRAELSSSSEDEQMQESQIEPVRDQPVPQKKTATKPIGQRGNIERAVHSQVTATFETHIQQRLQSMQQYTEIVPLTHQSFLTGYTRRARLYRVVMPLQQFRSVIYEAMWNHGEALLQGKWCFTMTPAVRDNLFWIDLAGEEVPTYKTFDWTQRHLPAGQFCSIDKLEVSMEYHKFCHRTTHHQPPVPVGAGIDSTVLSNIRGWSSVITDLKMAEIMRTKAGALKPPPLPQEWPAHLGLDTWPMICWTVGSLLVQK